MIITMLSLSKTTIIGVIALIALLGMTIAVCLYLGSDAGKKE